MKILKEVSKLVINVYKLYNGRFINMQYKFKVERAIAKQRGTSNV